MSIPGMHTCLTSWFVQIVPMPLYFMICVGSGQTGIGDHRFQEQPTARVRLQLKTIPLLMSCHRCVPAIRWKCGSRGLELPHRQSGDNRCMFKMGHPDSLYKRAYRRYVQEQRSRRAACMFGQVFAQMLGQGGSEVHVVAQAHVPEWLVWRYSLCFILGLTLHRWHHSSIWYRCSTLSGCPMLAPTLLAHSVVLCNRDSSSCLHALVEELGRWK